MTLFNFDTTATLTIVDGITVASELWTYLSIKEAERGNCLTEEQRVFFEDCLREGARFDTALARLGIASSVASQSDLFCLGKRIIEAKAKFIVDSNEKQTVWNESVH